MDAERIRQLLDPEVAAALAQLPLRVGDLTLEGLPAARAAYPPPLARPLGHDVDRTDHRVPADATGPEVMVRVHRPRGVDGPLPCLVWMHGGGLVVGTCVQDDPRFDDWCVRFGLVGVSVEYRLAPETPYPGPIEDCHRALRWVHDNAHALGVAPACVGVGGASAGAGLAAALALLARDRGGPAVAFQLLVYPMLDDRQITPSSRWDVPVWGPGSNRFGWRCYLGDAVGGPDVPPTAAAARATDLGGLPPALVQVGTLDGFVDEDVDYAMRLNRAGVPVELHVYDGAPHGYDTFAPGTALARRSRADLEAWLRGRLAAAGFS